MTSKSYFTIPLLVASSRASAILRLFKNRYMTGA